ncbi:MAG: hypothetical protein MN733_00315 [Nitrososphaera sp.]|nr:hypothetical protein [Nitrososphaera sp.]
MEILIIAGLNAAIGAILVLNGLPFAGVPELSFSLPEAGLAGALSIVYTIMKVAGILVLPLGFAFFGATAGLFLGKGWAWTMSRKLMIAGIALGFAFMYGTADISKMGLYTLGMALSGVVIGFLHTAEVREFYGKQVVPESSHRKHSKRKRRQRTAEEEDEIEEQEPSAAEVE